jgi:hypothetical protein
MDYGFYLSNSWKSLTLPISGALPEEAAERVQQETARILKGCCKPKDSLSCVVGKFLQALNAKAEFTVLTSDKDSAIVVLNTAGCNQKMTTLL